MEPLSSTPTVQAVHVVGYTAFTRAELNKSVSLKIGTPLDLNQVRFSRASLEGFYRDKGYAEVHISTAIQTVESGKAKEVTFHIDEGPRFHVNSLRIEGNQFISEHYIKRQMNIHPGDPFSQTRIFDADQELFMGGYFETIDITYSSSTDHGIDITTKVKERPTRYMKGGVGYGAETKERLSLGYEDRNFFGGARRFDIQGVYSGFFTSPNKYQTTAVQTSLAQPYLFDSAYEGQTTVAREWDRRDAFDATNTTWRSSVGRQFGKTITANLQYRYQGVHLTRINPEEAVNASAFTNISAIGPIFTYDNTNDPFLPSYGWRINGAVEKGLTWGVGDLRFYKTTVHVGRFDTFFQRLTFFEGVQGGFERPDDPMEVMPIFERFYLGGANTVRGYEERELGPKDNLGAPLGGEAFGVMNLELRYRLYKKLVGVTFLDGGQLWQRPAGDTWPTIKAHSLNDFAFGSGVGLRLHTPVGAVRLEVGYKLNPPDASTLSFFERTAIHFSLGEVF